MYTQVFRFPKIFQKINNQLKSQSNKGNKTRLGKKLKDNKGVKQDCKVSKKNK